MSRATRATAVAAAVAALFAALLVGTFSTAGAEPEGDLGSLDIYTRGTTYTCTSDVLCFAPVVLIRCKPGDYATGGAAWYIDNPSGDTSAVQSRPWRKNGASRGWMNDSQDAVQPDDQIRVEVICAG